MDEKQKFLRSLSIVKERVPFRNFPALFEDDKRFLLDCIYINPKVIYHASDKLKNDREIVDASIDRDKNCYQYISESLKREKSIILECYSHFDISEFVPKDVLWERSFLVELLKIHSGIYRYISDIYKEDKNLFLVAIRNNNESYLHTSPTIRSLLREDRSFLMKVLEINGMMLKYTSKKYRKEKEIVLHAIKQNARALLEGGEYFLENEEVIHEALHKNCWIYRDFPETLKNDRDIVIRIIKECPLLLYCIPKEFRKDKEIVYLAVKNRGNVFVYAEESLLQHRKLFLISVKQHMPLLRSIPKEILENKKDMLKIVRMHGSSLHHFGLSNDLFTDRQLFFLMLHAFKYNHVSYIPKTCK